MYSGIPIIIDVFRGVYAIPDPPEAEEEVWIFVKRRSET
jgi:hypothetical protein